MSNYLMVRLPSGSWRYVTKVLDNDLACSIYNINALDSSNLDAAKAATHLPVRVVINRGA